MSSGHVGAKWQTGSRVIFSSKTKQDLLLFPAQLQEEGHAVAEMEGKPGAEVIWVYNLIPKPPDGGLSAVISPCSPARAQPVHSSSVL